MRLHRTPESGDVMVRDAVFLGGLLDDFCYSRIVDRANIGEEVVFNLLVQAA